MMSVGPPSAGQQAHRSPQITAHPLGLNHTAHPSVLPKFVCLPQIRQPILPKSPSVEDQKILNGQKFHSRFDELCLVLNNRAYNNSTLVEAFPQTPCVHICIFVCFGLHKNILFPLDYRTNPPIIRTEE
jgi:hypothetical protein